MGLLDSVLSQATSALSNNDAAGPHGGLIDVISGLISGSGSGAGTATGASAGGLPSLINAFREKGLGAAVESWISTGHNLPITAEQLQGVLGNEYVAAIAQKLGLSTDDVATSLAHLLPKAIDAVTPNGQVPEGNVLAQGLGGLLKSFGART